MDNAAQRQAAHKQRYGAHDFKSSRPRFQLVAVFQQGHQVAIA